MNSLAYADDICLAASSKEETQHLLDQCMEYVKWAGFAFNTKKCGSLCLVNQTSPIFVDHLYPPRLDTDVIPALSWEDRYKYLGCPTGAFRSYSKAEPGISGPEAGYEVAPPVRHQKINRPGEGI